MMLFCDCLFVQSFMRPHAFQDIVTIRQHAVRVCVYTRIIRFLACALVYENPRFDM